jgi:hypothetical protein
VEPAEKVEVLVEPIEIVGKPVAEIVVACEPALLVANLLPEAGGRSARKSSQSVRLEVDDRACLACCAAGTEERCPALVGW